MHVLWVENKFAFVRIVLKTFLAGHDVVVTPSVAEARQQLAQQRFDAVLLDYDLNDGKGTELLPDIKRLSQVPYVITASSQAVNNALLTQAGADTACSKRHFAHIHDVLMRQR